MLSLWKPARKNTAPLTNGSTPGVNPWTDVDRLFDSMFDDFALPVLGFKAPVFGPPADVTENDDAVVITVDLPGISRDDIRVTLEADHLTVHAERKADRSQKSGAFVRSERTYGSLTRTFAVPAGLDPAKVQASYTDGVLTVTLPRKEEAKPKAIEVKVR